MPSDFFSQNMAVLKKNFPLLAEEIEKAKDEGDIKVEMTASGLPTLVLNALYLHSKRDPVREAERLVESAAGDQGSDTPENPALVLGFGLGYAAGALAAKFPEKPIIVVERRANILRRALEERDLAVFLSRKGLVFVLDVDGVSGALSLFESYPGVPPLVIQNRALADMDEDWYTAVEDRIRTWHTRTNVNRATQRRFGKRWVRNLSRNLEVVRDIPGISRLERLLSKKNIPVFLAAAGPTLDATGTILDEIFKRCLIVATDTSLRFFLRHGIDPDFVVSVDPQYWNSRHLVPAPKTRMIAESAVYPSILRNQFSGIFLCASLFPLGRFIEDRLEPRGNLGAGGSVATSAWDFARHLGAGTIWIAGLDLSFPEFKTHFKGALFEEKSHAESGRFLPMETWSFRALRDGQPFTAKSLGGSTVLTDKRLSLYAAWFENRFSQHVDVKNFSLSNEGLALKGLKAAPKEELLALPECRKELDSLLNEVFQTINMEFNSEEARAGRVKSHKNVEETLLKGLGEIKGFAEDAAEIARAAAARSRMGHLDDKEKGKALDKLGSVNKSISKSEVKEVAGFLFPETDNWAAEISSVTTDPFNSHLEFSGRFYRALADAAAYNLQIISKVPDVKADIFNTGREILHKV